MKRLIQILVIRALACTIWCVPLVAVLTTLASAQVPQMINYQGKLTDTTGAPVHDTLQMVFTIYADSVGTNPLWTETQGAVIIEKGVFNVLLGSVDSIPYSVFNGNVRYLGIKVGDDAEITPRKPMVSVGYAMKAGNAREVYHQIIDVMPNSTTKFYVAPKYPNSKVTLYLHGEGFEGAILAHTHTGENAHSHVFSGTTGWQSVGHTHDFSGNTGYQSADHTHSATTSSVDLTHSHSGGIGNTDLTHSHSGSIGTDGDHGHWFRFVGVETTGPYLVHSNDLNGLSTNPTERNAYARLSVMNAGAHSHSLTINNALGGHAHTLSINNSLGLHSHTFTTGGVSANHYHGFSGTTGGISANHNHGFSGTTESSGTGLGMFGVVAGTLPQSVNVYVDGILRAGPWSGQFSSGPVDLSPYIPDTQEHSVEIKEEGGNGGRIIYNFYIE